MIEVKNPDGRDRITKSQAEFLARWPEKVHFVRSPAEAIKAVFGELADSTPRKEASDSQAKSHASIDRSGVERPRFV